MVSSGLLKGSERELKKRGSNVAELRLDFRGPGSRFNPVLTCLLSYLFWSVYHNPPVRWVHSWKKQKSCRDTAFNNFKHSLLQIHCPELIIPRDLTQNFLLNSWDFIQQFFFFLLQLRYLDADAFIFFLFLCYLLLVFELLKSHIEVTLQSTFFQTSQTQYLF